MEIDINQQQISIGDKYKIFVDGQEAYRATRHLFNILPVINLFEFNIEKPRFILNKKASLLKQTYELERWDGAVFQFITRSIWKSHYQCQYGPDRYDIYGHKARKYSIYKNDIQVAWWDKQMVTWFKGDNYKIVTNKDEETTLIISFCLIIDNLTSSDNAGKFVVFDFGNIGPEAKRFDKDWQPK